MEILQILWQSGPSTVKEVNSELAMKKEVGYTTTLKILQIMYEKELVTRKKKGKSHVYSSKISQYDTRQQVVDKIVNTVFQGSAMKLVMQALGNQNASPDEINEIRKYLNALDTNNRKTD